MQSTIGIIVAIEGNESEEKIRNTIDSAILQTYEKTKTIIAADFVSKDTEKILNEYKEKFSDKVVLVLNEEKRGRGGAFNLGLRNVNTDWIAFLNEGDILKSDFASKLVSIGDKDELDVVACRCNYEYADEDEEIFKEAGRELDFDAHSLLCVNPGRMEAKIYKRNIFDDNGLWFPEGMAYEKLGIERLALFLAEKMDYVNEELYEIDLEREKEVSFEDLYDRLDVMTFFIEECYKREFLEEFPEEVEAAVIDDMYISTLFTYMAITPAKKRKITFLNMLRDAITDCFPEFETNPYYYEKYDDDLKDLISLHVMSPYKFIKQTMKMKFEE